MTWQFQPSDHQRPDSVSVVCAHGPEDSFTMSVRTEHIDEALIHDGPVFRRLLTDLSDHGDRVRFVVLPDSIWTVSGREVIHVEGAPLRP